MGEIQFSLLFNYIKVKENPLFHCKQMLLVSSLIGRHQCNLQSCDKVTMNLTCRRNSLTLLCFVLFFGSLYLLLLAPFPVLLVSPRHALSSKQILGRGNCSVVEERENYRSVFVPHELSC